MFCIRESVPELIIQQNDKSTQIYKVVFDQENCSKSLENPCMKAMGMPIAMMVVRSLSDQKFVR